MKARGKRTKIRLTKKNLIFPIVAMAIMILLLVFIPFKKVYHPEEAKSIYEIALLAQNKEGYVDISLDKLTYTGYDYCKKNGERCASYYYALDDEYGVSCVFFLLPVSKDGTPADTVEEYKTKARIISDDEKLDSFLNQFAPEIGWNVDGLREISHGFIVSEYDYKPWRVLLIAILACVVIAASAAYIVFICIELKKRKKALLAKRQKQTEEFWEEGFGGDKDE